MARMLCIGDLPPNDSIPRKKPSRQGSTAENLSGQKATYSPRLAIPNDNEWRPRLSVDGGG